MHISGTRSRNYSKRNNVIKAPNPNNLIVDILYRTLILFENEKTVADLKICNSLLLGFFEDFFIETRHC